MLDSIRLPLKSPGRAWPSRTGLLDLARASTPREIHRVSLGLDFDFPRGPWLFEGCGLDREPVAEWGRWSPSQAPPGWWRVSSDEGVPVRQVRFHAFSGKGAPPRPGLLWLRALAAGQPLVFCPGGLEGPGFVVTPGLGIPWADRGHVLGLVQALDKAGGAGLFPVIDPKEVDAFMGVFGGYFSPGAAALDPLMKAVLRAGVPVRGFDKAPVAPRRGRKPGAAGLESWDE